MLDAGDRRNLSLVIRKDPGGECVGVAALDGTDEPCPMLGLWLRVEAQNRGYGREVVGAVVGWASQRLRPVGFCYPVAVENVRSRRIAEHFGGVVISRHTTPKYEAVVYQIPATVHGEIHHG